MHSTVPHLQFPLRVAQGGGLATWEQDTVEDVAQCVEILLMTPTGSRIELIDYGVPEFLFAVDLPMNVVMGEIERWEPRASVVVKDQPDRLDELVRNVNVRVATRREP